MMDEFLAFRAGLKFLTPAYFVFFNLAAAAAVFLALALLLKLFFRPRRSRNSHYRLFGPDLVWLPVLLLVAMAVFALAGPETKRGFSLAADGRVDVILAVDNSFSASADDLKPSRLKFVQREVLLFLNSSVWRSGDRFTLFTFAKNSNWRMPFSKDIDEVKGKLAELSHPEVYIEESQLTTDLSAILEHIPEAMDKADNPAGRRRLGLESPPGNRIVFLFSDGDDQVQNDLNKGLRELKKRKIKVYAIGTGTKAGRTVRVKVSISGHPRYDEETGDIIGYYGHSEEWLTAHSALQTQNLARISGFTGGGLFVADSGSGYLQNFLENAVNANRSVSFRLAYSAKSQNVWWEVLAVPALVILFLAMLLI